MKHLTFTHRRRLSLQAALVSLAVCLSSGCSTPQVLESEKVFTALDALWTAVTSRKVERLRNTSEELSRLRESGELSQSGWNALEPIIELAFREEWESAAKRLKKFIRAQRKT